MIIYQINYNNNSSINSTKLQVTKLEMRMNYMKIVFAHPTLEKAYQNIDLPENVYTLRYQDMKRLQK